MDGMGLEAADYGMIAGEVFAFSRFLRHQNPLKYTIEQFMNNLRYPITTKDFKSSAVTGQI